MWAFSMLIGLEYLVIVTFENKCMFFDTRISVQILDKAAQYLGCDSQGKY